MEGSNGEMKGKRQLNLRVAAWLMASAVALGAYLWASVIYHRTLVQLSTLVTAGLVLSLISWFTLRRIYARELSGLPSVAQIAIHAALTCGIWMFLLLEMNSAFAVSESQRIEEVEITEHMREERYRSQRVGRHTYRKGTPYYIYKIRLQFPDGQEKEFSVTHERYRKLRTGMMMKVEVCDGLLGYPVIKLIN